MKFRILMAALLGVFAAGSVNAHEQGVYPKDMDHRVFSAYWEFGEIPTFESTECLVSGTLEYGPTQFRTRDGKWHGFHKREIYGWIWDEMSIMFRADPEKFISYNTRSRREAINKHSFLIRLFNRCDEKEALFQGMKDHLMGKFEGFSIDFTFPNTVPEEFSDRWGPNPLRWTDGEGFDAPFWAAKRKAMKSCEWEDWLAFSEHPMQQEIDLRSAVEVYLGYSAESEEDNRIKFGTLAMVMMPEGPQREALKERLTIRRERQARFRHNRWRPEEPFDPSKDKKRWRELQDLALYWLEHQSGCPAWQK